MSAIRVTLPEAIWILRESICILELTENLPEWNTEDVCNSLMAIGENLRDVAYFVDKLEERIRQQDRDQVIH